ncbi:hypothetical protein AB4Y40_21500 [Paraburkholderia sp. EG287B]|uniref:hypothetical protein n=1 Tax=Paraburkholderia sp. EG287B TaxID=3237010 RepID=UPI0034D18FAB
MEHLASILFCRQSINARVPVGAYGTLGAPRHRLPGELLNRLNQSGLDFPILAITGCALSDKARDDVIDASECCWTPFSARLKDITALDTMLQASMTVANAHKSGLQSFGSFLCLKTRVRHES